MQEIVPGIWTWHVHDTDRDLDFNGWYVHAGDAAVVIDPPPASEGVLKQIAELGRPEVVLLTNKHHSRASARFREVFDCPIHVHENDAKLMDQPPQGTFRHGDVLPCGLLAVTLPHGKTPGETAFLFRGEVPALIVGDAVIGKPAGTLSMLPPEKFSDPAAAKEGLAVLLDRDFEALLLGDGQSFLQGGRQALEAFLAP